MEGSPTLSLPPGFRFHPTDEELITHYLTRKVSDYSFFAAAITEVDLTKSEPWDLPAKASMGEKEWYFFSLKDRKYPTGLRTNRATKAGYWKTTGRDKEIHHSGLMVGMKKTLVFYKGRAPKGVKTNWVMHEYRLQTTFYKPTKEQWVVCRVFQKSLIGKILTSSLSPLSALEESSDTNLANKLSDHIDYTSNLGSLVGFDAISPDDHDDKDINMNWGLTNYRSLVCPPSMLQSSALGAFQLDSYHPCKAISTSLDPLAAQSFECSGIDFSPNFTSSSSKNIDYVQNTFNEAFESVN